MEDKAKKSADFILGSKAADLWLYTCDACANEKVIPKKYRYTCLLYTSPSPRDTR